MSNNLNHHLKHNKLMSLVFFRLFTCLLVFSFLSTAQAASATLDSYHLGGNNAIAQTTMSPNNQPPSKWLTLGAGVFRGFYHGSHLLGNILGPGATIETNYNITKHQLLTAGVTSYGYSVLGADIISTDIGLLYGLINNGPHGYVSASAGLSYVHFKVNDQSSFYDDQAYYASLDNTIGVPIELQAFRRFGKHFAIGLIGTGNINHESSFLGLLGAVQIPL